MVVNEPRILVRILTVRIKESVQFANVTDNENGILCSLLSFKLIKQNAFFPTHLCGSQTLVCSESPEVLLESAILKPRP